MKKASKKPEIDQLWVALYTTDDGSDYWLVIAKTYEEAQKRFIQEYEELNGIPLGDRDDFTINAVDSVAGRKILVL